MPPTRVTVGDRELRGVWRTDLGQSVEQWVPAGEYDVIPGTFEFGGVVCRSIVPAGRPDGHDNNGAFYVAAKE